MTLASLDRVPGRTVLALLAIVAVSCGGSSSQGGSGGTGGASTGASGGTVGSGGSSTGGSPSQTGGKGGSVTGTGGSASGGAAGAPTGAGGSATGGSATGGRAAGGNTGAGGAAGQGGGAAGTPGHGGSGGASAGAVPSAGCGKTPTLWGPTQGTAVLSSWPPAGRYVQHTIQVGNANRTYYIQVPSNYDNTHPYRLVMAYHWYTGAAIEVVDCHSEGINCYTTQSPFFGLWELADSSTIFVAPDGTPAPTVQPASSPTGSPKVTSSSAGWGNSGGQDIKLTTAILQAVEADLCIDTSRIFANGFSYGGAMSYEVTCDPSTVSLFRGVAIYSGSPVLSGCSAAGGKPSTPIAAFLSHGTQDPTNMFSWGQTMRDNLAADNGCKTPSPSLASTVDMTAAGTHMCYSYDGCSAGHPVEWCVFGKQEGCTSGDHSPTPCDKGASKPWEPAEVWKFISQF